MLPTWTYARSDDALCVNLFIGGSVNIKNIAGTNVEVTQNTDYPWSGEVSIAINPAEEKNFTVKIRIPNRNVSTLYASTPACNEIASLAVNGVPFVPTINKGYASISRTWKAGDTIELVLPMKVQRIKASDKVAADAGRVALRYGALIYNVESVDQDINLVLASDAELTAIWKPDLLGGVVAIEGTYANGTRLLAIPNYARNNRGGHSIVWLKDQ